jgi:hypothetical protein
MTKSVLARRVVELKPSGISQILDIAATMQDVISLALANPTLPRRRRLSAPG